MFLLVSVRPVGAHPGKHQHGVSIQISISLILFCSILIGVTPAIDQLAIIRDRLLKQLNTIESFNAYPDKAFKTVIHLAVFETESR